MLQKRIVALKILVLSSMLRDIRRAQSLSTLVKLRPYQESCINACVEALASGSSRIGVSLPTGSGKTTVFLSLLSRLSYPRPAATRSLIIVNSVELARQTIDQAKRILPHLTVELEQGSQHQATGIADM